jgi:hypothetical protein
MNLPRRGLADIADGRPLFASVVETGSQPGNLDRLARGEADATAGSELIFRRVLNSAWPRSAATPARQAVRLHWI